MKRIFTLFLSASLTATACTGAFAQLMTLETYNMANTAVFTTDLFRCIGVGSGGHVWAGTLGQGLYKFDGTAWAKSTGLTLNSLNDIAVDEDGGVWIGQSGYNGAQSTNGGVNYFPNPDFSPSYYFGALLGLPTRTVRSLYIDTSGVIWTANMAQITGGVSQGGGVGRGANAGAATTFTAITAGVINDGFGSCQAVGNYGAEVWVYADKNIGAVNQLLRYDQAGVFLGFYDQNNTPALPAGFVARAIHYDSIAGNTWVGLASGGLVVYHAGAWTNVSAADIFPAGAAVNRNAIASDPSGKVYIGTTAGLLVYSGGSLTNAGSYDLYTTANGLPSDNINFIAVDGNTMWLATNAGIVKWIGCGSCSIPAGLLPRAGATGVAYIHPHFEWDRADGPDHTVTYELEVKDLMDIPAFPPVTGLTATRYEHTGDLLPSTEYKWRIRATVDGCSTAWSEESMFTTCAEYQFLVNPVGLRNDISNPNINAYKGHWNNSQVYFGSIYDGPCSAPTNCTRMACNCTVDIITGLKWQCVEFVNRYYYNYYGLNLINGIGGQNAKGYTRLSDYGLEAYNNGNANLPRPGDIVVWSRRYGHVAIVKNVLPDAIDVIQQNTDGANFTKTYTLSVDPITNGYRIGNFSGTRPCAGWVRAEPKLVFPQDNDLDVALNPVFKFEEKQNPIHQLFIFERDANGCYQSYFTSDIIRKNQFSLPTPFQLQAGKEYMVRVETTVKGAGSKSSGIAKGKPIFFKTSNSLNGQPLENLVTSGCDTATSVLQFFTLEAGTNPTEAIKNAHIYAKLEGSWRDMGFTGASGNLFVNGLNSNISTGDSVYMVAHGFEDTYSTIEFDHLKEGIARVSMASLNDPTLIVNPAVVPWSNNAPMPGLYVTQPNIQVRVTAENHTAYHLIVPTEIDDSVFVSTYPAAQELLPLTLNEGFNSVDIMFTNSSDTVFYSTTINYYPPDSLPAYTYDVHIQGDAIGAGAAVYVNGAFVKNLTGQNEIIPVPDYLCSFAFSKSGYSTYFENTFQQDTIAIPWQPFVPGEPVVQAAVKAFLQGPYVSGVQLMHDSLRVKGLIPLAEPYTGLANFTHAGGGGGEQTTPAVLAVTGSDAIVDWVFLELRSAADSAVVVATRAALLQRDGDVVDVDGISPVAFGVPADQWYAPALRHRNHLGVQLGAAVFYPACEAVETDFRNLPPEGFTAYNNLNPAQKLTGGVYTLWTGNGRIDYLLKYNGSNNDRTAILGVVGLSTPNAVVPGYLTTDYNLDGQVKYNGSANDRNVLLGNVGIATPSAILYDQIGH